MYSALWVQGTLVACYVPFGIAVALTPQRGMTLSVYLVRQFTVTLLIVKLVTVLLEDQRSKTICERNIKAIILSIELFY